MSIAVNMNKREATLYYPLHAVHLIGSEYFVNEL